MTESVWQINWNFAVNENTICIIRCQGRKHVAVRSSTSISTKVASVHHRDPIFEKMKRVLNMWVETQKLKVEKVEGVEVVPIYC